MTEKRRFLLAATIASVVHLLFLLPGVHNSPPVVNVTPAETSIEISLVPISSHSFNKEQIKPVVTVSSTDNESPPVNKETSIFNKAEQSKSNSVKITTPSTIPPLTERGALVQSNPRYKYNPAPVYPLLARRKGYEGIVILKVEVLANGKCGRLEVINSSGYVLLDKAAIQAVKKWEFIPAQFGGITKTSLVHVPIQFRLGRKEKNENN